MLLKDIVLFFHLGQKHFKEEYDVSLLFFSHFRNNYQIYWLLHKKYLLLGCLHIYVFSLLHVKNSQNSYSQNKELKKLCFMRKARDTNFICRWELITNKQLVFKNIVGSSIFHFLKLRKYLFFHNFQEREDHYKKMLEHLCICFIHWITKHIFFIEFILKSQWKDQQIFRFNFYPLYY